MVYQARSRFRCEVCQINYESAARRKIHIRKHHFNLTGKVSHYDLKEINQVWCEKIFDKTLEITKTGETVFLMRKLDDVDENQVTQATPDCSEE